MKTYSAEQIAGYFLSLPNGEENDISNLKLQKLCFYAQGLLTAMRGAPLFQEEIQAWDHGPVVPLLYHKFKGHGSEPIPSVAGFDADCIDATDRAALDDIYGFYGQYSAWALRNLTHEEKPWIEAYKSLESKVIRVDALVEHFEPQIDQDYIAQVYGQAQS